MATRSGLPRPLRPDPCGSALPVARKEPPRKGAARSRHAGTAAGGARRAGSVRGLNTDLEIPQLPVSLFGDLGRVGAAGLGERSAVSAAGSVEAARDLLGRTLADAGLSYIYGPIRLTAPVWVSRPGPGQRPWRFRWLLSLEALPISF